MEEFFRSIPSAKVVTFLICVEYAELNHISAHGKKEGQPLRIALELVEKKFKKNLCAEMCEKCAELQ